ncbi:hypothetical protein SDC9_153491 [bioreactor metagenome]|uniref:Uncharacterized protein n=1 Tax=bioreactor metagenome TaxID=1076179 RepID=A0A645EW38_9ZZZZ
MLVEIGQKYLHFLTGRLLIQIRINEEFMIQKPLVPAVTFVQRERLRIIFRRNFIAEILRHQGNRGIFFFQMMLQDVTAVGILMDADFFENRVECLVHIFFSEKSFEANIHDFLIPD